MVEIYYTKIDLDYFSAHYEQAIIALPEAIQHKVNAYASMKHKMHEFYSKKMLDYVLKQKQLSYTLYDLQ
jgi:hypothetical protein